MCIWGPIYKETGHTQSYLAPLTLPVCLCKASECLCTAVKLFLISFSTLFCIKRIGSQTWTNRSYRQQNIPITSQHADLDVCQLQLCCKAMDQAEQARSDQHAHWVTSFVHWFVVGHYAIHMRNWSTTALLCDSMHEPHLRSYKQCIWQSAGVGSLRALLHAPDASECLHIRAVCEFTDTISAALDGSKIACLCI